MILENISELNIGIVLRRKEAIYKNEQVLSYDVFNLKSYDEGVNYEKFYSNENLENYTAKQGDLLFRLAYPIKVIQVTKEMEGMLITNQYCFIRMTSFDNAEYDIGFIKWFLESEHVKKQLEKYLVGTAVKSIPVAKLRLLKIPNTPITKQKQISNILDNWNKQQILYEELLRKKENYYNATINNIIKGDQKYE